MARISKRRSIKALRPKHKKSSPWKEKKSELVETAAKWVQKNLSYSANLERKKSAVCKLEIRFKGGERRCLEMGKAGE